MRLLQMKHPMHQIRVQRQQLISLEERLKTAMRYQTEHKRAELLLKISRLKGLSPLDKLEQGLAYVSCLDGTSIHSVHQVEEGDTLNIQLKDGSVQAVVTGKEHMDVKEKFNR